MKKIMVLALVAASALSLAQQANWSGALTANDPTYNRAGEDGSFLSGVGSNVYYDVQPFWVTVTGAYTFEIRARNGGEDTFAFIYQDSFNPANALVNWKGGDDDWLDFTTSKIGEGEGTPGNLVLDANRQYFAITTSFANGERFEYDNVIRPLGNGRVNLGVVPEPTTMVALGAGIAAFAARRRRK
ncbi:MAG: PEP-CTERM sorting domain-containing protein [Fimbriimonadaceae bacterium]|nr:PEP-CTERM sorting domain-containing protein [Fimbriimonadaceae bacterium]QYK55114.1 MAG: PEP-CTERM sorting domain-containing protein [Fimbriimonadaceae bacterium]